MIIKQWVTTFLTDTGIVSREAVAKGDMDKFPVGCGAFKVESFEKNRLILAASSYYPKKELIYWSKINFTLHEDHKKASLLLLRGQIDFIHSFFTTTIDANPSNNPELAKYLYKVLEHETLSTVFLGLNRRQPQLSDVRVRRAINMAIDKQTIIKFFVKDATLATQVLPPGMPGYDAKQTGYAYDPVAARALLKEAGFEQGLSVELLVLDRSWIRAVARIIQDNLMEVGIKIKIRTEPLDKYLEIAGDPEKAGIVYSEGIAWFADYPEASNFYWPLFSKDSIKQGWNWAYHENEDTDELARQADAFVAPENQLQRLEGWRAVYRSLHQDAAWVPLYHNTSFLLKSPQVQFSTQEQSITDFDPVAGGLYMFSSRKKVSE